MLSRKDSYSNKGAFKYFLGYISNDGIIPLCIKLPQMNIFAKSFDSNNKYMSWWQRLKLHSKLLFNYPDLIMHAMF